jgi:hypothetical protein
MFQFGFPHALQDPLAADKCLELSLSLDTFYPTRNRPRVGPFLGPQGRR